MPALKQQTAKKRASGKAAHLAQAVKGPVDYKALRKELIAEFPKTLARLAE